MVPGMGSWSIKSPSAVIYACNSDHPITPFRKQHWLEEEDPNILNGETMMIWTNTFGKFLYSPPPTHTHKEYGVFAIFIRLPKSVVFLF